MINIQLWYSRLQYYNVKYAVLLALAGLHYNEKITDEKLKGQFQALRKGTLITAKKTYHCDINDRWYDSEPIYNIFQECLDDSRIQSIPYKEFIKYIQLFENKNYNYALNIFGSDYIYIFFKSWNPEYYSNDFTNYIDFYIPNVVSGRSESYCYECGHGHVTYNKNSHENLKVINEWIHSQKKGNLKKIPMYEIDTPNGNNWFC